MLVNFKFKNCRSFLNEANLSLEATTDKEYRELNTFFVDEKITGKGNNELLKSAIIFGANATGKTNVLKALAYMKDVVATSGNIHSEVLHNEPFLLREGASNEESLYEIEIIQNNTFYRFGFTILKGKIKREWLYTKVERLNVIYEREDNKMIKVKGSNKKANSLINISSTCLFLYFASHLNLEASRYAKDVYDWFNNLVVAFNNDKVNLEIYDIENEKYKKEALEILKMADLGIEDINVVKDKVGIFESENDVIYFGGQKNYHHRKLNHESDASYNIDLETSYNVYNDKHEVVGQKNISLFKDPDFNAEGTIRLLYYLGLILRALDKGQVLVLDEIDLKLHIIVCQFILDLFNSISENPNNAQLICTAHTVLLMDDDIRRDQIYFTSKNSYGESTLMSLADFRNVRKEVLFSKKYLAGFYTYLPDLNLW